MAIVLSVPLRLPSCNAVNYQVEFTKKNCKNADQIHKSYGKWLSSLSLLNDKYNISIPSPKIQKDRSRDAVEVLRAPENSLHVKSARNCCCRVFSIRLISDCISFQLCDVNFFFQTQHPECRFDSICKIEHEVSQRTVANLFSYKALEISTKTCSSTF